MIRWSRICKGIGLSLLIFTLGGCAKETATVDEVMEEIKTTEQKETEDTTLGLDDIILQVGDTSVTYREVLFYIYKAKEQYEDKLGSDVWDVTLENGNSFEDYAKEELLMEITEIKIIGEEAKKNEVSLTAGEEVQAENEAAAFLEAVTDEEKKEYGFETELIKDIYMEHAIANKMYEKTAEDAKVEIDEEDYRQVKVQYIHVMTNGTDKNGKTVSMSDEEKEKARKRADKLLAKAKTSEDFEAYATEKTSAKEVTAIFGKEDMPEDFGKAALALKTGEFSEVIEGKNGYYILYCENENVEKSTAKKVEEAKEQQESEAFQEAYTKWSEEYSAKVSVKLWQVIQVKES